jgi:hypothetical protein
MVEKPCPSPWESKLLKKDEVKTGIIYTGVMPPASGEVILIFDRLIASRVFFNEPLEKKPKVRVAARVRVLDPPDFAKGNARIYKEMVIYGLLVGSVIIISACICLWCAFRRRRKGERIQLDDSLKDEMFKPLATFAVVQPNGRDPIRCLPLKDGSLDTVELTAMQESDATIPEQLMSQQLAFK